MKVILTEKVRALGNIGEIVNVSPGFGRNYLIPNKFAVLADEGNKKAQAHFDRMLAKKVSQEREAALEAKKKIDALSLELIKRVGASGKLFGMVTTADLAKELETRGVTVEKRVITVDQPIKSLGQYEVKVKLFKDVEANFKVKVTLDPAQAEEMKKKQELAAKMKEQEKAEAQARAESGEDQKEEEAPLTEEQRLKAEADRLLRS